MGVAAGGVAVDAAAIARMVTTDQNAWKTKGKRRLRPLMKVRIAKAHHHHPRRGRHFLRVRVRSHGRSRHAIMSPDKPTKALLADVGKMAVSIHQSSRPIHKHSAPAFSHASLCLMFSFEGGLREHLQKKQNIQRRT